MAHYPQLVIICCFLACSTNHPTKPITQDRLPVQRTIQPEWQSILDSADVDGSILIYDAQKKNYYSNNFDWASRGQLPASTFKIANSIIALETGIVESDSTLFKWDGQPRALKNWEQDLTLRDAFHFSCVPCYQEIARNIGIDKMQRYLSQIEYPGMQVDAQNLDIFWLQGNSRINQFQQIEFLNKLHQSQLIISPRTEKIIKRLMVIEEKKDFTLRGKTGWSVTSGHNNGWFVGYITIGSLAYFFSTNIEPKASFNMEDFPSIRKEITFQSIRTLNLIN